MTNNEAIKILQFNAELADHELRSALDLAISALEEKERNKVHCGECKYMLGGYSGYYECSKNHWRIYKAYSCEDGEKK